MVYRKKTKLFVAVLAFINIFLIGYIASTTYAGILIYRTKYALDLWENDRKQYSPLTWNHIVNNTHQAIILSPFNAEYIYELARLYEFRAMQYPVWSSDAKIYRKHAINKYRQALLSRPIWPQAWLQLSVNKVLNQQLDDEVIHALRNVLKYGRWEADVNKGFIALSMAIWAQLPSDLRLQITNFIINSVRYGYSADYIRQLIKIHGLNDSLGVLVNEIY